MKSIQSKSTLEQIELSKLKQYFLGSSDEASKSVCVYSESGEDLSKIFSKHDRIEQIKEGSLVTFSTPTLASKAASKRHGKKGRIVCLGFTPPLIALGHNPNIFVVRNLIEEITIPQLWAFLDADENLVSHISVLPTLNRDVIILCKDKEGQKQLLSKNRTKLGKWTIQIDLWWEFCASLMSGKELFVENLPEGTTFDSLKTLLGVGDDDLRFVQIDEVHQVSLIVCGSKDIKNKIAYHGPEELRFSLLPQLPSDNQVFLNNLHETTTELDVRNFMSGCGNVMKVVCWLDNRTGRKKARVIFEVSESSENALKLDGTVLKDLPVSVGPLTKPTGKPTPKSTTRNEVYIIATTCLRHLRALDLCLMFQDCGYIEDIKMPIIDKFMRSKPAVIRFRDAEAVQKALSKKLSPLRGVRLIVSQQEPKSKPKAKSFPHRRKHTPGKRSRTHTKREDEEPSPAKKNKVQHFDED